MKYYGGWLVCLLWLLLSGCAVSPASPQYDAVVEQDHLQRLARRAEQQGNSGLAIRLYRQSLAAEGDANSRQALFWLYRRAGYHNQAAELLQQQPWPRQGLACAQAATAMDNQQWQQAEQLLQGIAVDQHWPECLAMQARLALQQHNYSQATAAFEQLRQWQPQHWRHSYNLALVAHLQHQPELAIRQLRSVCSQANACPAAVTELMAMSLVFAGQSQQARQWLLQAGLSQSDCDAQLQYFQALSATPESQS